MKLVEAMYYRKSNRKYSNKSLPDDLLKQIKVITDETDKLYKDIEMRIHLVKDGEKIQNIMGRVGRIKAPHFLVITSEEKEGYLENVGYTLEEIVLKLTTMGIATCWLGGHVKRQDLVSVIDIGENQKPVVLISFGYPESEDDFLRKSPSDVKRKEISEFASGQINEMWSKIMEAVRIAPSAANVQPWRFFFENKIVHLYSAKPTNFLTKRMFGEINRLDAGIALRHIEVASKDVSKIMQLKRMDLEERKGLNYITSIEVI